MKTSAKNPTNHNAPKYLSVKAVELTSKEDAHLRKKFEKYTKVLQWVGMPSTYYIHHGSNILKHSDTEMLFNLLAAFYIKDKEASIW